VCSHQVGKAQPRGTQVEPRYRSGTGGTALPVWWSAVKTQDERQLNVTGCNREHDSGLGDPSYFQKISLNIV